MAQAYAAHQMSGTAVFETLFRKLPDTRSYIMAAGLSDVLDFLEALHFDKEDLEYLLGLGLFTDDFVQQLAEVRFTGDVWAVEIIASSGLDEYRIAALLEDGCPIDSFAMGTKLVVAKDAAALDMAYKLVEYEGTGRTKFSSGKVIYPGRKPVFRRVNNGVFAGDVIVAYNEQLDGDPLLVPVMKNGKRLRQHQPTLSMAREWTRSQVKALPPQLRSLDQIDYQYPVDVTPRIARELGKLRRSKSPEMNGNAVPAVEVQNLPRVPINNVRP